MPPSNMQLVLLGVQNAFNFKRFEHLLDFFQGFVVCVGNEQLAFFFGHVALIVKESANEIAIQ